MIMSKTHHSRSKASSAERKLSVFARLGSKSKNGPKKSSAAEEAEKSVRSRDDEVTRSKGQEAKKMSHAKKLKEKHRKPSGVHDGTPETSDQPPWDLDLEGADEKFLQKRRLQLQRELRLQLKREKITGDSKKTKKPTKKVIVSSSSGSSSESSSSSSSSSSSHEPKQNLTRKRKKSPSSGSESSRDKRKKTIKTVVKAKIEAKKKPVSPRKAEPVKKSVSKKSFSPSWERRSSPVRKKTPPRVKQRPPVPKSKPREPSPKRVKKSKERRLTPPARPPRPRTPDRRHRHSPRPRHSGPEKGEKILPVKSLVHPKDGKVLVRRKTPDRVRDTRERENERIKEKRRRELKIREMERREKEREAERIKREAERQKDRDEALARSRERQRERERLERMDREKRIKDFDRKEMESRKAEVKSDLPSLLDIKTEAPRETTRRGWEDRRGRRPDDNFDFRHPELNAVDERRRGYDAKWSGENSGRDVNWRDHHGTRRPIEGHSGSFSKDESRIDDQPKRAVERNEEPRDSSVIDNKADLAEVLSDISDDADDILNQEEPNEESVDAAPSQLLPVSLSQPSAEFFFDSRRPLLECLGDRLDFEEISDEELEEEAKMGRGIMDVLGADWASLMTQKCVKTPKTETAGCARRRWHADAIIQRIGISAKLAGQDFVDKYLNRIKSQNQENGKISPTLEPTIKEEPNTEIEPKSRFLHSLPAIHAMLNEFSEPSPIFRILNSNKHALSARSDLSIRRVACGFAPKESLQLTSIDDTLYEANLSIIKLAAA